MDHAVFFDVIGVVGFVCYITGYALLQLGWIAGDGNAYRCSQLAGASCMLISLSHVFHLGSALIQTSYIMITLVGFLRARRLARWAARDRVLRARRAARRGARPLVLSEADRLKPDAQTTPRPRLSPEVYAH